MATEKTLDDLFLDTLKDIYYAEKQIVKALKKMARGAQSPELKKAFDQLTRDRHGVGLGFRDWFCPSAAPHQLPGGIRLLPEFQILPLHRYRLPWAVYASDSLDRVQ